MKAKDPINLPICFLLLFMDTSFYLHVRATRNSPFPIGIGKKKEKRKRKKATRVMWEGSYI
jgi:hypothetical protein